MDLNAYSPQIIIGACVVVLVVMLAIIWGVARQRSRRRTAELRTRFGSEYDFAMRQYGSRRKAEDELEGRLHRIERLSLRPISAADRARYLRDWDAIQARFLDHPRGAVIEADELIASLLQARGYPGARFEQRVADISVDYPRLADPYRRANAISVRAGKGDATTEDLRSAMVLYRAIFEELLQTRTIAMPRAEAA